MGDDQRPTLNLAYPVADENQRLDRILIGMTDAYTGLAMDSFRVTADFEIDGAVPGENLADRFQALPGSRWQWKLTRPITKLEQATLTVTVQDRQGNTARIERRFSVQ
jgi:hypothetical protein